MESKITEKFTLYDILSMIIPGGVIIVAILWNYEFLSQKTYLEAKDEYEFLDWLFVTGALIASYIVGICNIPITECIWSKFRNDPEIISAWNKAINGTKENCEERNRIFRHIITHTLKISLFYTIIVIFVSAVGNEPVCCLKILLLLVLPCIVMCNMYSARIKYKVNPIVHKYYKKYYYA